jgi:hypothetical protein
MKKNTQKIFSLLIALCMILSITSTITAFAETGIALKANSSLTVGTSDGAIIITGAPEKTTVEDLLANFESAEAIVASKNGITLDSSAIVGTGTMLSAGDLTAYVIIKGDTDGNGEVSSTDYLQIKSHFIGKIVLEGFQLLAADANDSGSLDSTDYLQIKSYFLGDFNLYPENNNESEDSSEESSDDPVVPEEFTFQFTNVSLVGTESTIDIYIEGTYTGVGSLTLKLNNNNTDAVMENGKFTITAGLESLNIEDKWYDIHVYYNEDSYVDINVNDISYDIDAAVKVGDNTYKFASYEDCLKVYYQSDVYNPYEGIDPSIAGILMGCKFSCDWVEDKNGSHENGGWYPVVSFKGTMPEEYRSQLSMISSLKVRFANGNNVISENVTYDSNYNIDFSFDLTKLLTLGDTMNNEWFYIEVEANVFLLGAQKINMPLGLYSETFIPDSDFGYVGNIGVYKLNNGKEINFNFHYGTFDYKVLAVSYSY